MNTRKIVWEIRPDWRKHWDDGERYKAENAYKTIAVELLYEALLLVKRSESTRKVR